MDGSGIIRNCIEGDAMKLEYIKLENFALLRAGMNISEIELDFRKAKNSINLIIGNNGTGKTGLLSNLHPFATLGHLDNREDQELIIPEKDGRKFAIFSTKKHTYEVEHFYQWQPNRSRIIKSYFRKDGVELNKPGTVKSFLDIVQREMDIDINFLKLIRLGGNAKNFVELTSAERFSFIGKLLVAVEKYLNANKLLRARSSALNTLLKNTLEKKDRLGISDITIAEEVLSNREKSLEEFKKQKEQEIMNFYSYKGKINIDEIDECEKKASTLKSELEELRSQQKELIPPKKKFLDIGINILDQSQRRIDKWESEKFEVQNKYSEVLAKSNELDNLILKWKDSSSSALDQAKLNSITEFISKLEKNISDYESSYTKDPSMSMNTLLSDVDKINMIYFHFDNIMEASSNGRVHFCKKMLEFNMNLPELDKYFKVKLSQLRVQKEMKNLKLPKKKTIMFIPTNCTEYNKCPFYRIGTAKQEETATIEDIETELETVEDASGVATSFYAITKILSMRDPDITEYKITQEMILEAILKSSKRLIVDADKIQSIRSHIESFEEYTSNLNNLDKMKTELELGLSKSNGSTKEEVLEKIKSLEEEKNEVDKDLRKLQKEIARLTNLITDERSRIDEYNKAIQYKLANQKITNDIEVRENGLSRLSSILAMRESYLKIKSMYDERISELTFKIDCTQKSIEEDRMKIKMFKQLSDEILSIQEKFDYITDLKEITSLSDGIPLIHIKLYCRALCTIANEIIKRIYQGDFRIKKFDIREGVFNIPYYTKGFTVKDIRDTSQAEASVAKLAISFAILSQFMTKYNIPLLDEVDGPMHQINKEKFFSSIEGILHDTLKCEQAFLITQSTMFNEYPVNFIVTDSEYKHMLPKNANIIFQR